MNCLICGVELSTEKKNVYHDYGAHAACVEKLHENDPAWPEWREAMEKIRRITQPETKP